MSAPVSVKNLLRVSLLLTAAYGGVILVPATAAPSTGGEMFSISVDGKQVAGTKVPVNKERRTDVGLDLVDIAVKFDGLDVKPMLNVSTYPIRQTYQAGERVTFLASNNYPAWITKSEIRIFAEGQSAVERPAYVISALSVGVNSWVMPQEGPAKLYYVLRVYDQSGRFDETRPLSLTRTTEHLEQHAPQNASVAPGYSDDRTAFRNIPVEGGAVTVYGKHVPAGHFVNVLGEPIPLDQDNSFVVQRILPSGNHHVDVAVVDHPYGGKGLHFDREINIPTSDWFYIVQSDLTVGYRSGSPGIEQVLPGEYNNIYTKGRLAFYVKGKIKGQYLLTVAGDTGESSLDKIFVGLDGKNPHELLKRINPNDYYPVYGDDSTLVEDAPTRGKFYLRLQKDDSHVMWGNFKTKITGTEFLRNERSLYGASGVYRSVDTTPFGERKTEATVYAAQPDTLPQHEIMRGTGGSAYFLKHQDITIGSETLNIEVHDPITGNVLSRTPLRFGADYDIDYIQGLVLLKNPLASSTSGTTVISNGASGGNEVYLSTSYEFTPVAGNTNGYNVGGRAQQWLGDHVRVGVTGQLEKTSGSDQALYGADILLRKSDRTYIEGEVAQSSGPGFSTATSADGGLTVSDNPIAGVAGLTANAYRVHAHAGLDDLMGEAIKGDLDAYFNHAGQGFTSLTKQTTQDENNWGLKGSFIPSDKLSVEASVEDHSAADGRHENALNIQAKIGLDDHWSLTPAVKQSLHQLPLGADNGSRTEMGAKLAYRVDEHQQFYGFGQGTVLLTENRKSNNRVGLGFQTRLSEKVDLSAEGSYGDGGVGAKALLSYKPTADDHYYLGYTLDPSLDLQVGPASIVNSETYGKFVLGANHVYSKTFSVFMEDAATPFTTTRSLTQTYGVKYTPEPEWAFGSSVEFGNIWDNSINASTNLKNSDFTRKAFAGNLRYHNETGLDGNLKLETRFENSDDHTRDLNSYLLGAGFGIKTSDNWRAIGSLNTVIAQASTTALGGTYFQGSLGYAYRPITNDRFNALFKYNYVLDMPGPQQVSLGGTVNGPWQMSHILSADANYDLNSIVTIGGKYGFRMGSSRDRANGSAWLDNSAHLGVVRLDIHVVKNWDALLEGRALWSTPTQSVNYGALAAIYRHFGDNFKIGLGYNMGSFSDDLSHISAVDYGVFINVIGKF